MITRYLIEIKKKDGTYLESAQCDGSNMVTISNLYCEVDMTVLYSSSYSLVLDDLIVA